MNQPNAIEKIVIAGGGSSGWLAAATLGNMYRHNPNMHIELVASEEVGIIGVGEATIPPLLDALHGLGIDEADLIKSTQASFKLGIEFRDWHTQGEAYFHPFGKLGSSINGHEFYQCWLKAKQQGCSDPLMAFSPEACLSAKGRFFRPFEAINTPLSGVRYALHIDAVLFSKYLKDFAIKAGVKYTQGHIADVEVTEAGDIANLVLKDKQLIKGDFFIDCTGFKGLLIEKALKAGYHDWSHLLRCNTAVAAPSAKMDEIPPFTIATAKQAGWTWQIPLQHRVGNGYVYCRDFCSDDEATATLLDSMHDKPLKEPRVIPFTTGVRRKPWHRNCLSLGLAQGFLEPLESTAIHLVTKSLIQFIKLFPDKRNNETLISHYNDVLLKEYGDIRDFLILHYCTTNRQDSPFWQWCKRMELPDSLQDKLKLFRQTSSLAIKAEDLFQHASWHAVLTGMKVYPKRYNPGVDTLDFQHLQASMRKGRDFLHRAVENQPAHRDFINTYCKATPP